MSKLRYTKAVFQIFIVLCSIFLVYFTQDVDAGCCAKFTINGEVHYCESLPSGANCEGTNNPQVDCVYTTLNGACQKVTCFINNVCHYNMPRIECEEKGGTFNPPAEACQEGCCLLPGNCFLTTQADCDAKHGTFRQDILLPHDCIMECRGTERGCCVTDEGCTFVKREDCENLGGGFHNGEFCSSSNLQNKCGCVAHNHTGCLDYDLNHVYWFDSCGNPEEPKEECPEGIEICTESDGKAWCEEISCETTWDNPIVSIDGVPRKNGESWCEYHSPTGPGLDLPGSTHYIHSCAYGLEHAEPAVPEGGREKICVAKEQDFGNGLIMSVALNLENRYDDCLQQTTKEACEDAYYRDCIWMGGKCLPRVPPSNTNFCNEGDMVVTTVWKCRVTASGKRCRLTSSEECCEDEDDCKIVNSVYANEGKLHEKDNFNLKNLNYFCMSLGDCGASLNVGNTFSGKGFYRDCALKSHCKDGDAKKCKKRVGEEDWRSMYGETFATATPGFNFKFGTTEEEPKDYWERLGDDLESGWHKPLITGTAIDIVIAGILAKFAGVTFGKAFIALMSNPAGWIILGIGFGGFLLWEIISNLLESCHTKDVTIDCKPWQPPEGGEECWRCSAPDTECKNGKCGLLPTDEDGNVIDGYQCLEYTCWSLGKACQFIPGDQTVDGISKCIKVPPPTDVSPPVIKIDRDKTLSSLKCCTTNSQKQKCSETSCSISETGLSATISPLVSTERVITITIKTTYSDDSPYFTVCGVSKEPPTPENPLSVDFMNLLDYGLAGSEHNITIPNVELKSLDYGEELKLYVKCKPAEGVPGTETPVPFVITMVPHFGPDLTQPVIEWFDPSAQTPHNFVAHDAESKVVIFGISETIASDPILGTRGECRVSRENVPFDQMDPEKSVVICPEPSLNQQQICRTELRNFVEGENKFYFACNDTSGNIGQTVEYTLIKTPPLNITEFYPSSTECYWQDGEINCYTYNITLRAVTQAGALNGQANCSYGKSETNIIDQFYQTGSTEHIQPELYFFAPGRYTYYAICQDVAGNKAVKSVTFNIRIDRNPPEVKAVKKEQGNLVLTISDEIPEAVSCEYAHESFVAGKGTAMQSDMQGHFYAGYKENSIYYIKCYDKFGNAMKTLKVLT